MLISLNEIKKLVAIPEEMSREELLGLIGSRLVEIEDTTDLAAKYENIYIAKVVSAEKIPETHLTVCQVNVGDRTEQVVCGAPNVHQGMLAVWIAPGAIVPQTYGNENFRLSVRKLRGYESHGMLAAIDELDLGTDHEGIAEIDPRDAKPGDKFTDVFELNDLIIDVENKSLTHRPDCFGLIGFAREVAGILDLKFEEPEFAKDIETDDTVAIDVAVKDAELCPRYSCAVFDLPDNTPSKYLTKEAVFLAKAGMRAIDPMVDMTNMMMLLTGQPLHAFDYDKFVAVGGTKTPKVIVRAAKDGEELQLLDGKTVKCNADDILITSGDVPVAMAGAMGGKNTEIDASTKRVVLESATFSLYHLRKTQMAHGIFSEAITRFTKGQPANQTMPVLRETLKRLNVKALAVVDEYAAEERKAVTVSVQQINALLGSRYMREEIVRTLANVGFTVTGDEMLAVTAPEWRTDIHIAEDVIEEVGRLRGFDNIALDLPVKKFSGTEVAPMWALKQELRKIMSGNLAMNELLTYSFISKSLLEKVGLPVSESYEIVNSISPELQCFRQQIAPSLLDKMRENLKNGHNDFALYEMNQVSCRAYGLTEEGTPKLETHLGIAEIGDFYKIKAELLLLAKKLHVAVEYQQMPSNMAAAYPYLEAKRSAVVIMGGEIIGAFGEVKKSVLKKFKVEATVAAAEISLNKVVEAPRALNVKLVMSRFPFVERDVTLKVGSEAQFGRFYKALSQTLEGLGLIAEVKPLSVYQSESATKNISFHLKFANAEKTLEQNEISDIMEKVTTEVTLIGAELV